MRAARHPSKLRVALVGAAMGALGCRSEVAEWVIAERGSSQIPASDAGDADAGTDAADACPFCPGPVVWSAPTATPQFGSRDATEFDDACPEGEALIGFQGSIDDVGVVLVSSIQGSCGKLVLPNMAGDVGVIAGAMLPERGSATTATWSQMCPRDQVVVGFYGRSGISLDQVGFDCARVRVSRSDAGYALDVDATISELSPPNGGGGGQPYRARCDPGQIARVVNANIDQWVHAFGLTCATPLVAAP